MLSAFSGRHPKKKVSNAKDKQESDKDKTKVTKLQADNSQTKNVQEKTVNYKLDPKEVMDIVKADKYIIKMLDYFNSMTNRDKCQTTDEVIKIDLPSSKETRKTIRVNEEIYMEFDKLCNSNKHLLKKDIISLAFKEFVEKYK